MKITVINGSPKGKMSVTLQSMFYAEKIFKDIEFKYIYAGQLIKNYEKDFLSVENDIKECDVLIFAYPVYTFLVPTQLHRFIELMKENNLNLKDKFVTQYTTSKHFYDMTAHKFVEENCADMGMKIIKGLSHDMESLLKEKGQKELIDFFNYIIYSYTNDIYENITTKEKHKNTYIPQIEESIEKKDKTTVILTNYKKDELSLQNMIKDFSNLINTKTKIINIADFPFRGGCLGCFRCSSSGKCIYKDGFDEFLRNEIQVADSIVYAFTIKDHSMGADFKMYDDRQFCNGHRAVTHGMPIAYLVSGNLSEEDNLRMVIEARSEVGGNFLAGIVCDENNTLANMKATAQKLMYALDNGYVLPANFYGEGGRKIFRDLVYVMRGLMSADHEFYKQNGIYDDLPHKQKGKLVGMSVLGIFLKNQKVMAKMGNKLNEGILMPYKKVLSKL